MPYALYAAQLAQIVTALRDVERWTGELLREAPVAENTELVALLAEYVVALLSAVDRLLVLCLRLAANQRGTRQPRAEFYREALDYRQAVRAYSELGLRLNRAWARGR